MRKIISLLALLAACAPSIALAHEVYVLDPNEIAYGITTPPFDMLATLTQNLHQVIFWAFVGFVMVSTVFCISIFRKVETRFARFFNRIRPYASAVARVTVGIGFIASGYFGASFGPELPLATSFGSLSFIASAIFVIVGATMIVGFSPRATAIAAALLFVVCVYRFGVYMLTYINYFGEFVVLFLIGSHHRKRIKHSFEKLKALAFPALRVCFGISLIYSSVYAKVLHNHLALQVADLPLGHAHSLAYYFGFEPHFMVLGAAIIEVTIGLFYIFGVEIRWTSLFLLFWLTLSLLYFGESVWPHIILIGIPIAFIMHGYDKYSLEGYFFKKGRREPVF